MASTTDPNHISRVALIGATGSLGSNVLSALLAQSYPQFSITSDTHPDLTSDPRITIIPGSYTDHWFLVSALANQDALIITLAWSICHEFQPLIIRAACEAKVPYILPCEFGSDTSNPRLISAVPMQTHKVNARKPVEELGGTSSCWIGIINNAWYDWSLAGGWFGIDIKHRKATLFDKGDVKAYTSTLRMSDLAAARVLSLPLNTKGQNPNNPNMHRTLPSYANKMVYVSNFHLSQVDMLRAVQQATHTTDADWDITAVSKAEYIEAGFTMLKKGEMSGIMNVLYGNIFTNGVANGYYGAEGNENPQLAQDNAMLGLEGCEDLEDVTGRVVREVLEGRDTQQHQ
ncbi:uncharacterized protein Z518_10742 [Rhinocladiella mackenziei CBS 650.93]|uniref:NmrA-like domain-containing protein n=1 Tax=Rhinocladiella mackenziei CBS 650.93 TaxID=1442369 RepID=A0A0D2ISR8_9EURO|nr:uncharacterized protein Z518_10742 [Rhinocladiella mackenziei CBS 650.93]KIW99814.1 hypothetical protein Z518_10742 [Rhinocladiella mackenziei CBS 650.93]